MSNVPKLRFKEFSEEWEKLKLGKYLVEFKEKSTIEDEYPVLTSSNKGLVLQKDYFGEGRITDKNNKGFNIVPEGYVTYRSRSDNRTFTFNINTLGFTGIISTYYPVFKFHNGDDKFFTELMKVYQPYIGKYSVGTSQTVLSFNELKNIHIHFPSKQEQEKIASFLNQIDIKIEQLIKKEELLQQYKKGVMQKIFNQEIRFRTDDESEFCDWEEKKLGDILDYIQPTKYLVKDTEYNDSYTIPVLTAGKTFILGYTNETDGVFENNLPVIIFDDFTTANKFVNFPFKAKSSAMKILVSKNNNIKFIYEAIQMIKYEVGGHERHWISKFSFLNIFIPCIEEQTKIANFLSSIDSKIEKVKKQLNSTKEFKKALLQQMFV